MEIGKKSKDGKHFRIDSSPEILKSHLSPLRARITQDNTNDGINQLQAIKCENPPRSTSTGINHLRRVAIHDLPPELSQFQRIRLLLPAYDIESLHPLHFSFIHIHSTSFFVVLEREDTFRNLDRTVALLSSMIGMSESDPHLG